MIWSLVGNVVYHGFQEYFMNKIGFDEMKNIGVIGAGVMGRGVVQCFAQKGFDVVVVDISDEILKKAGEEIFNSVRFQGFFNKSGDDPQKVLERIRFTTDYGMLEQSDFLVENVPEQLEIKEGVYRKIDSVCQDNCVFAVNTSCVSITKIASLTKRPEQVIGTHFMNPVPLKTTIEVIRGYHTSDETIQFTQDILGLIGKECIIVNDFPGFVSNRISHLFMNEAAYVVQDGVASASDVDSIFKKCFGHKMGPLETADLIGLDTVMDSLKILYDSYEDSKFRCCPLLKKMVDAGLLGKKAGEGFYKY